MLSFLYSQSEHFSWHKMGGTFNSYSWKFQCGRITFKGDFLYISTWIITSLLFWRHAQSANSTKDAVGFEGRATLCLQFSEGGQFCLCMSNGRTPMVLNHNWLPIRKCLLLKFINIFCIWVCVHVCIHGCVFPYLSTFMFLNYCVKIMKKWPVRENNTFYRQQSDVPFLSLCAFLKVTIMLYKWCICLCMSSFCTWKILAKSENRVLSFFFFKKKKEFNLMINRYVPKAIATCFSTHIKALKTCKCSIYI